MTADQIAEMTRLWEDGTAIATIADRVGLTDDEVRAVVQARFWR